MQWSGRRLLVIGRPASPRQRVKLSSDNFRVADLGTKSGRQLDPMGLRIAAADVPRSTFQNLWGMRMQSLPTFSEIWLRPPRIDTMPSRLLLLGVQVDLTPVKILTLRDNHCRPRLSLVVRVEMRSWPAARRRCGVTRLRLTVRRVVFFVRCHVSSVVTRSERRC